MKKIFLIAIVLAVIIGGFFLYRGLTGNVVSAQSDELAKCLTEKGAIMYGTIWCSYCQRQKEAFGSSFKYIKFVDCDANRDECLIAGVQGYPTWKINGETYSGLRPLEDLARIAGCEF